MSRYTPIIQDLESTTDSFSSICRKHDIKSSVAHTAISKVRPDLLGPRSARLGHTQFGKTDIPDNVRADALAQVLAGRSVKLVAESTGVPAPTLYQMVRKVREKEAERAAAEKFASAGIDENVVSLLLSSLRTAAKQVNLDPIDLCDLLKTRFNT